MRNKSFYDFLSNRETYSELAGVANAADTGDEMQAPAAKAQPFDATGMTKADMPGFSRSLRQMLSTRGVVQNDQQKEAAQLVLKIMRAPIMRLVNQFGLGPDDVKLVVQEVINIMVGMKQFTGFNQNRVKSKIMGSISDPENMG